MKKTILAIATISASVLLLSTQNSCYKDNKETMYPSTGACDTSNVTWTNDIKPIVNASCATSGCHDGGGSASSLTTYNSVKAITTDGTFVSYIESGYMPKGSTKLDACSINKVRRWMNTGALEN